MLRIEAVAPRVVLFNTVEWFWLDLSHGLDDQLVSFSALTLLVWSSGL